MESHSVHIRCFKRMISLRCGTFDTERGELTQVDSLIETPYDLPNESIANELVSSRTKKIENKIARTYTLSLVTMLVCGSSNDYLGKLIYQILPALLVNNSLEILVDYWVTWILTAGTFFVCSFALIKGRKSFKILTFKIFLKICIPSFMDLFVTGGRYLAIIFLPAAIISILKNGFQLAFLALISTFYRKKKLTKSQWIGLFVTIIGLIIVSLQDIISNIINHDLQKLKQAIFGTVLLIIVGFLGAIRNMMEEILLQNDDIHKSLDPNFLVGMESAISLLFLLLFAILYLFTNIMENSGGYKHISFVTDYLLQNTTIIILFIVFLIAVYGKETMQMKITKLTSSLTRKLFQQLYPIGTWILSLITYYIYSSKYGEQWNNYSWLRVIGFNIILIGTYLYIKTSSIALSSKPTHQTIENIPETDIDDDEEDSINIELI